MRNFTSNLKLLLVLVLLSSSYAFAQNKAVIEDLSNTGLSVFTPDESQLKARLAQKIQSDDGTQVELIKSANAEITGEMSSGPAPYKFLLSPSPNPNLTPKGSTAWGCGLFGSGLFTLDVDVPGTYISTNPLSPWASYAGDYDNNTAAVYYIIDNGDGYLKMINVADGSIAKTIGLPDFSAGSPGISATGMACDRTTGTMYVMCYGSTADLFTIDVNDASTTYIGSSTGLIIDIAIDGAGVMYGHSLSDQILTIDKTTGASTVLGATGFDANYAQGASYDPVGGVVYLAAYNNTVGQGELRSVNTTTGATTLIGAFPGGEENDAFAFPNNSIAANHDVLAGNIVSPATGYELTSAESVIVNVYNIGTYSESNIPIHYIFDGGTQVDEIIPGPIPAGGFVTYTFATTIDVSGYGSHTIEICTDLVLDDFTANDCVSRTFDNIPDCIAITAYPYVYTFDNNKSGVNNTEACTFDGSVPLNLFECWENVVDPLTEDIDWDVMSGSTPSGGTGPTGDHTSGTGLYMFTEASACYSSTGTILSPEFDFTSLTNPELEFWYHMWGVGMGTMSCEMSIDGGTTWIPLWTLSGDQGNSWQQVKLDLLAYTNESSVFFHWVGLTGLTYDSDMALDDVFVREKPQCSPPLTPSVSGILNHQADLNWVDPDGTMWEVEIRELTVPLTGTATHSGIVATTLTPTGLKQLTEHHWQVRSDCGSGVYSDWVMGTNFTTLNNGDCIWSICLNDDWGDGWDIASIDVTIDGILVFDDLTLANGTGPECRDFMVLNTNSTIDITYTSGYYPEENSYYIYSNYGVQEFLDGTNGTDPVGVTGLVVNCDAPPVPANDLCTSPTAVTGPFPVTVSGTTAGASPDICSDNEVVWYEIELPYNVNYVTIDFCPTADILGSPVWSILANLYTDCDCNGYGNSFLDWYGCGYEFAPYMEFAGIPGPGTILYAVSLADINGVRQLDFQFDIDVFEMIPLDLTVFLEGPYDAGTGSSMFTDLNTAGYIPLNQPYDANPSAVWYYTGTESVAAVPSGVVDWVVVQLRDAADPASASSGTIIGTQALFLLNDGSVVGRDGLSPPLFFATPANNIYGVIYHRNHLGIMSNNPIVYDGVSGLYTYDYSSGETQVYGGTAGHKDLGAGVWGMIAADGDANGTVQLGDKNVTWLADFGLSGYLGGDFDMNGVSQLTDKNVQWLGNLGTGGQIPAKGFSENYYFYKSQIPK